ncbi:MAG: sulfotransferase [Lewinella sp.]
MTKDPDHGGPGYIALDPELELLPSSPLATESNREKLMQEWSQYWDMDSRVLVEKSPPNIARTLFLQHLFPDAFFVTIIRHPIPVAQATRKHWSVPIRKSVENWVKAYELYREHSKGLRNELFFSYEQLISEPDFIVATIEDFLDITIKQYPLIKDSNDAYFRHWKGKSVYQIYGKLTRMYVERKYGDNVADLGYSFDDYSIHPEIRLRKS